MLFIRSLIYTIVVNIALIIIITIALLIFFLPIRIRYNIISLWAKFCIWWLKITCKLDFKIIGKENIPTKTCVVMSNHQSTWDTLVFQTFLPQQTWVIKKELLFLPIFGWGLALLRPISIDRGNKLNAIRTVIKQGVSRIKDGIWVIIYPEGTRQPYKKLANYQSGGVAIAKKSGVDILPIYHNAGKFWSKGQFIKKPGTIVITIGKSINPQDEKPKDIALKIENWAKELEKTY